MRGGVKKAPERTLEDELADMLSKTMRIDDKRRSLRVSKKPERLVMPAPAPKKRAAPRRALPATFAAAAAPAAPGAAAAAAIAADAATAQALRNARAGIYDPDEAAGAAAGAEAERIQTEKIQKIQKILDAEIALLETIRRQIQVRRDYLAQKRAAAEADAAAAAGPSEPRAMSEGGAGRKKKSARR